MQRRTDAMSNACDTCTYYIVDEGYEEYVCDAAMDEDDYVRLSESSFRGCPYYRDADEYKVVRKQK